MAQTTRLASFGPVFAVPVQSVAYLVTSTCIYNKCIVSTKEKTKEKRKKLTYGPNDARRVVWARSCRLRPPCPRNSLMTALSR